MAEEEKRGVAAAVGAWLAGGTPAGRRRYSRIEMEALKPPESELQRRWWASVYQTLDPMVAREYEGLCGSTLAQHKRSDGRRQSSRRKKHETDGLKSLSVKPMEDSGNRTNVLEPCQPFEPDNISFVIDECGPITISECDNVTAECDSTITEESFDGEEKSDDDYASIQRPAFLVEGEPNFESGPPEDGLEYLRRVRWEAIRLPRVKVVNFDMKKCKEQTSYMPKIPDIPRCPENLLPSKDWVDAFLVDFANLRQVFSQIECSLEDQDFCTAATQKLTVASEVGLLNDPPMVSALLAMESVTRTTLLRKQVGNLESESSLSRSTYLWIFALCVAVDAPFDADMCATMRSLLRKCSGFLATRSDLDDDEVAMLNILITISGNYFGQSERQSA